MRYSKGVIITLLAKGLILPIGLVTSIITARTLGPEGRGVLALMIFFQGLTVQFGTLGLNASITYFMSREPDRSAGIVRNAVTLAVVGGIVIAGLLWLAAGFFPSLVLGKVPVTYLEIFLWSVPFTFLSQFLQNVFLAKQKILEFNLLDVGVRFLQMSAFGVVLWLLGGGTTEAIWVFTAAAAIGGVVYVFRARILQSFTPGFELDIFKRMFSYGARVYATSIIMFLILRIHLMLINTLLGEAEAGVYSVALQLVDIIYLLPVTLGLILFPKISAGEDPEARLTKRVFRATFGGMTTLCIVLASMSKPLILFMYGNAFVEGSLALMLLMPGVLSISLVTILNNDLSGRGVPTVMILAPLFVLTLTIPTLVLVLPMYGIAGAAITSSAGNTLLLMILLTYFKRRFGGTWGELFIPRASDLPR